MKLVSETTLELGTGLQEIRCPLWRQRIADCQRISPCPHDKMLSQTMVYYLLGPRLSGWSLFVVETFTDPF